VIAAFASGENLENVEFYSRGFKGNKKVIRKAITVSSRGKGSGK
jgi:hypothetical protein